MNSGLKLCPFCGATAGYACEQYNGQTFVAVECDFCGLQTKSFSGESAWEEAAIAWNRRICDKQPTVDAVEVVRCKDCKHKGHCEIEELVIHGINGNNPFCSYGERKEENREILFP